MLKSVLFKRDYLQLDDAYLVYARCYIDIHKDSEKLCDNSPSLDKLIPSNVKGNVRCC